MVGVLEEGVVEKGRAVPDSPLLLLHPLWCERGAPGGRRADTSPEHNSYLSSNAMWSWLQFQMTIAYTFFYYDSYTTPLGFTRVIKTINLNECVLCLPSHTGLCLWYRVSPVARFSTPGSVAVTFIFSSLSYECLVDVKMM